jgi:hypothetical protein
LVETQDGLLEVLEGQQRLAAIRDFVRGKFSIDGSIQPEDDQIRQLHGVFYRSLSPVTKRRVDNYTVRAFKITDYSPEEPSELFYRLNQPTTLTAGEQRNSLYGTARNQLKSLVKSLQETASRETIGFSNARLAYDDVIARHLYFLEIGRFDFKVTESSISDFFRTPSGFSEKTLELATEALSKFARARAKAGKIRLNKASLLSWLLFFSRGNESSTKELLLGQFMGTTPHNRNTFLTNEAQVLFQDRASGRVTDVSSVVIRDFCLWASQFYINGDLPDRADLREQLTTVVDKFERKNVVILEELIEHEVNFASWGRLR